MDKIWDRKSFEVGGHWPLEKKGPTIAIRAGSKWGGVMIKLSVLSPGLLYLAFYFNSVVCRLLSVSS